jgi:phosphoglycerate dehydrogenase-like enzyme
MRRRTALSSDDPILSAVYTRDRLQDMLAICDYLLAAAPHTPETHGIIGEAEIGVLKRDAVVINVGRGPVIDESALIRALEEGRIKGAALDVFEHEPLPAGHPFYRLDNVLLSPHCADHTPGWVDLAMNKFVENFHHFWKGEPLENVVDKKAGY